MELEYNKELLLPDEPVSLTGLSNLNRIVIHRDGFILCKSLPSARNAAKRLDKRHAILTLKDAAEQYPSLFFREGRKPAEVKDHLVCVKMTERQIQFCQQKGNGQVAPYVRSLIDKAIKEDETDKG